MSGGASMGASAPPGGEQAGQSDNFVDSMGVNTHFSYGGTYYQSPYVAGTLATLGIRHLRDGMNASSISNGVYAAMKAIATANGITFDLVVDPRNLVPPLLTSAIDGNIASIGVSSVSSLEGANEYDLSGDPNNVSVAENYQIALQAGTLANSNPAVASAYGVTAAVAAYPIIMFSLGNAGASAQYYENQGAYATYGNMHSYPGGNPPTTFLGPTPTNLPGSYMGLAQLVSNSDPLWATETGYNSGYMGAYPTQYVSFAAEAKYIPRQYLEYFNRGILRTFIYEYAEEGDGWGEFIDISSNKTLAYTYVSNMISILKDPGSQFVAGQLAYTLSGSTANVDHTLLQKRNGRYELALWIETASYNLTSHMDISVPTQAVTVTLGAGAPSFSSWNQYNPSISTFAQNSGTGTSIPITVPDYPVILELVP
jgi:hypothetical protein